MCSYWIEVGTIIDPLFSLAFASLLTMPFCCCRVSDKQTLKQILTAYIHPTESEPVTRQKWAFPPSHLKTEHVFFIFCFFLVCFVFRSWDIYLKNNVKALNISSRNWVCKKEPLLSEGWDTNRATQKCVCNESFIITTGKPTCLCVDIVYTYKNVG